MDNENFVIKWRLTEGFNLDAGAWVNWVSQKQMWEGAGGG